jgi:hypothetical protein
MGWPVMHQVLHLRWATWLYWWQMVRLNGMGRWMMGGFRRMVVVARMPVDLWSAHFHVSPLSFNATLVFHTTLILKAPRLGRATAIGLARWRRWTAMPHLLESGAVLVRCLLL